MDKINSDHEAGTDTNMTKFEIAQSLMDCLQEIMSIVAVCRYEEPDLLPERVDDAIGDAECALDDIAVILGDARSLLQEVCDDGRAQWVHNAGTQCGLRQNKRYFAQASGAL